MLVGINLLTSSEIKYLKVAPVPPPKKIINKYDKIRILQVIKEDFFKKLEKNHLYIIDPLGNIFIFYDKDFSAKGLKKDIKKILKVSRIG